MVTYKEVAPPVVRIPLCQSPDCEGADTRAGTCCKVDAGLRHWRPVSIIDKTVKMRNSLGLHRRGKISLGTVYTSATDEKPAPMTAWPAMSMYMLLEPAAMPAPRNDKAYDTTMICFRVWKTSDADDNSGVKTAWTSDKALGTQV